MEKARYPNDKAKWRRRKSHAEREADHVAGYVSNSDAELDLEPLRGTIIRESTVIDRST
jgi:hypothetical protein